MGKLAIRSILLATAFTLAGCGGGGGGVASNGSTPPPATPAPPPKPTPQFVLVPAATTSQQFAVAGASRLTTSDPAPRLGAADQLQVRYLASSNSYEIELPGSQTWIGLSAKVDTEAAGGGVTVVHQFPKYQYSSLIEWFAGSSPRGVEAIGIATPAGAVPVTGTATYAADVFGRTSETGSNGSIVDPLVLGSMTLNFDFAHGSLSGNLTSVLDPEWHGYQLGTLTFRDTVYSTGSTTFSGAFDTNAAGVNSFSGLFTGPNAQEVIGNFAFPYRSPVDSQVYQASGGFVGK